MTGSQGKSASSLPEELTGSETVEIPHASGNLDPRKALSSALKERLGVKDFIADIDVKT